MNIKTLTVVKITGKPVISVASVIIKVETVESF